MADNSEVTTTSPTTPDYNSMSSSEIERSIADNPVASSDEPEQKEEDVPSDNSEQEPEKKPEGEQDKSQDGDDKSKDNAQAPDLSSLPEKFRKNPEQLIKSYNELQSSFTKNQQELAMAKQKAEEYERFKSEQENKKLEAEKIALMSDQEREVLELQKSLTEPVIKPLQEKLEKLERERFMEKFNQAEEMRINQNKSIFQTYIQAHKEILPVADQLWELSEKEGTPSDALQEKLPVEWRGKGFRELPYPVLFDVYFKPLMQVGKEEAITKIDEKANRKPLGSKASPPEIVNYDKMTSKEIEKAVGYSD